MSKFKYLLKYGIKRRIGTKAFYIANIVIFIALLALMNIPNIIAFFDDGETSKEIVYVVDDTEKGLDSIAILDQSAQALLNMIPGANISFETKDSVDPENLDFGPSKAIVHLTTVDDILVVDIYKDELDTLNETILLQSLSVLKVQVWAVDKTQAELDLIEDFNQPLVYEVHTQVDDTTTRDLILSAISVFVAIPIFIMLIMSVQFVGVDIIEEKSTKAIEFVMSTVPPQTHFMTKILSSFVFLIVQALLIFLYGLIAGFVSTQVLGATNGQMSISELIGMLTETDSSIIASVFNALPLALAITLIFMIVGGLFFMIFMATLASMSTSMEDFQSFQSPFMFTMLIGFYAAIFSIYLGDSVFLKVLAYIPLFSPIVVPTLYMSGVLSVIDVVISFLILIGSTIGMYYLLAPVYKASILSYDQSPFFQRIKKMFKRSKAM
ncbi:ABC transporter permease [Paracholeplasma manati]|uniref:ABC transporter permease n=1 Tax=Paracholeplasma manati TaxID=591373 RepID=A0ABT2Y7N6_9MOLU|nr:ABC transporter permease [Paracholeplasma manati]MCV2232735.1 ABC transporter permease [Paracholeplasma manati]MDG0887957.1 ABC transporter permease [Paracholeplasma manati]